MPDSEESAHPTLPAITLRPDLLGHWHASVLSLLLRLQARVFVSLPSHRSGGQVVPRWCERQPSVGGQSVLRLEIRAREAWVIPS